MLIKEHTMCAPEVKNRLVVNKQTDATEHHNYIADDIASYPVSCTYSDGTIEDYISQTASTMGYGQCTYLKQINEHGDICCSFVIGKARVTPLKMITIPRLELTAALLSIKISKLLKTAFKYQINEEYFWTDSTYSVVLL